MKHMWLVLVPLMMVVGCGGMLPADSGGSSSGQTAPIENPDNAVPTAPSGQIGCLLNCRSGLCDSDCDGWFDAVEIEAGLDPCNPFDTDFCPSIAEAARVCDQIVGCDSLNGPVLDEPEPIQDQDADGVPDDLDNCPNDPSKTEPGICGCAVADTDTDNDGRLNCIDNCPFTFNPNQLDSDSDGTGDACDSSPLPPFVSGDVFSFLTPDETELFLLFAATLNADIDRFVDEELAIARIDLQNRGLLSSTLWCGTECEWEKDRIRFKRDATFTAIQQAIFASGRVLDIFVLAEIESFNCSTYPNHTFECSAVTIQMTCIIDLPCG